MWTHVLIVKVVRKFVPNVNVILKANALLDLLLNMRNGLIPVKVVLNFANPLPDAIGTHITEENVLCIKSVLGLVQIVVPIAYLEKEVVF